VRKDKGLDSFFSELKDFSRTQPETYRALVNEIGHTRNHDPDKLKLPDRFTVGAAAFRTLRSENMLLKQRLAQLGYHNYQPGQSLTQLPFLAPGQSTSNPPHPHPKNSQSGAPFQGLRTQSHQQALPHYQLASTPHPASYPQAGSFLPSTRTQEFTNAQDYLNSYSSPVLDQSGHIPSYNYYNDNINWPLNNWFKFALGQFIGDIGNTFITRIIYLFKWKPSRRSLQ